ncbi:MAG: TerB N-terminal domain-containing protein, partial [Caldilineaceae bacterium]|nr:TerB N-terminal domain-containing protein [Caldilineaceae bacterium]
SRRSKQTTSASPWRKITIPADAKPAEPIPIPPREQVLGSQNEQSTSITSNAGSPSAAESFASSKKLIPFADHAKQLVARKENKVDPVPFAQYWPTYDKMSPAQQRWYFYWRSELRMGNFLPTDLSYLFVYTYECINLVGFDSPQAAFERLVSFWQYYRILQPKLDQYLIDWIADLVVIHRLPITALGWYAQVANLGISLQDPELYVESWLQADDKWETFSSEVLFQIAEFSPKRSKFRKTYQKEDLEAAYKKGIQAVDRYLQNSQGPSLLTLNRPHTVRTILRIPFSSAVHSYDSKEIEVAKIRPWLGQTKLRKQLKSIIKQTENVLRDQQQFGTKLLGIDLPDAWIKAIEEAFTVTPAKRTVTIDFSEVAELQRTSEELRQRLAINEDDEPLFVGPRENERQLPVSEIPTIDEETVGSTLIPAVVQSSTPQDIPYLQRPETTPPHLLTDLVEIATILGESTSPEASMLQLFYERNWTVSQSTLSEFRAEQFSSVTLDSINERALEQLGDALIFEEGLEWVVAEDYRDELRYILEHPAYLNLAIRTVSERSNEVSSLPAVDESVPSIQLALDIENAPVSDEWTALANSLESTQRTAICVLLEGNNATKQIDTIARSVHITANQLIDDINEIALETVGDILIVTNTDVPVLEEEYIDPLTQIFTSALSTYKQSANGVIYGNENT